MAAVETPPALVAELLGPAARLKFCKIRLLFDLLNLVMLRSESLRSLLLVEPDALSTLLTTPVDIWGMLPSSNLLLLSALV